MVVAANHVVQCLHVIRQKIQQTRKRRLKRLQVLVLHHRPANVLLSLVGRLGGEGVNSLLKGSGIDDRRLYGTIAGLSGIPSSLKPGFKLRALNQPWFISSA